MGDDQDSVDDPVEDAALLGDECEIKRDSVCVCFILFSQLVIWRAHRFRVVRCFQPDASSPASHRRSGWTSLSASAFRRRNAFSVFLPFKWPSRQCVQRSLQLYRWVSCHCRHERRDQSVEEHQWSTFENASGSWRSGMDSMALKEQRPVRFGQWLHHLELEFAERLRIACRTHEPITS